MGRPNGMSASILTVQARQNFCSRGRCVPPEYLPPKARSRRRSEFGELFHLILWTIFHLASFKTSCIGLGNDRSLRIKPPRRPAADSWTGEL